MSPSPGSNKFAVVAGDVSNVSTPFTVVSGVIPDSPMPSYKEQQRELEKRRRMVRVHDNAQRTPGALLRFSDRVMEVMPNGSLRRLPDIINNAGGFQGGWYRITNAAGDEPAEISIYGEIGVGWDGTRGVDAQAFARELEEIPRDAEIKLKVHSPGGSVWDGLLIYNLLRGRRDRVVGYNLGMAASAASFILMAAREIHMPKAARMMIHDAQGLVAGDSSKLKQLAELLERESDNIADIYAEKTGKTRAAIRAMMKKTTWMNGKEAKELGFADVITDGAVMNCAGFDLSHFREVPAELRNHTNALPGNPNTMNRDQIIALLRRHGIQVSNDATNAVLGTLLAQLATQLANSSEAAAVADRALIPGLQAQLAGTPAPVPATAPAPAPTNVLPLPAPTGTPAPTNVIQVTPEMWNSMQTQLTNERTHRITAAFESIVAEGRPNIDRNVWLPRALQDETVLNLLRALPIQQVGADPVRNVIITNSGNPVIEAYNKLQPGADRRQFLLANHEGLDGALREFRPRNANTTAAGLVPDYLADALVIESNNKLALLNAFAKDYDTDPVKPRSTVQVRKAVKKAGQGVQTNPTNFETGDSQVDAIPVTVDQISRSFHITNDEVNKGHKLAHIAQVNADIFVNGLSDVVTAVLIAANYPDPLSIGAAVNFDPDDLKPIRAVGKNFMAKNLVLDGGHLSYLLPTDRNQFRLGEAGAFGFDLIAEHNRWTNGIENLVGLLCSPQGIATASGLPIDVPPGEYIEQRTVTLPNGVTVAMYVWFSKGGRVRWASYDVIFGAGKGDANEVKLLTI